MSNKTQFTMTEAAKIIGIGRTTFYDHIEKRGISIIGADTKSPKVDASELIRAYPDKELNFDAIKDAPAIKADDAAGVSDVSGGVGQVSESVQREIEALRSERERERRIYEDQIDHLKDTLQRAQEGQNKLTLLLEHHSKDQKGDDWKQAIDAMEKRLANTDDVMRELREENKRLKLREEEREKRMEARRIEKEAAAKAAEAAANKSFFKKLFG